jgi:hypothetical protein
MADKGDVYYCCWKRNQDGDYVGWERKHPSLRAEAMTQREMVELLGDIVGEYHDDHEAALQFEPPLSEKNGKEKYFVDDLVEVVWNAMFSFTLSAETAFKLGRCKRCGRGLGSRTPRPLVVDSLGQGIDGAFSSASNSPPPAQMPGHLIIVSEAFLHVTTKNERATFEARPIEWRSKRRTKFFEIIPKTFIPRVGIKGHEVNGWRCELCGQQQYSVCGTLEYGVKVVCRSDLPSPPPTFFFVGDPISYGLCTSRRRWELLRSKSVRKLMNWRLAVVDEDECRRHPRLPTLDERAAFRRK